MYLFNKYKNCSYCNEPFNDKLWCKKCDPRCLIECWTSGNSDTDEFIKNTIYNVRHDFSGVFLEWVPFNRISDIKLIGEGGFSKVYSAIWINGKSSYKVRNYGIWEKLVSQPTKVALKKLNGSQNISVDYLDKIKLHWNLYLSNPDFLKFYGITKDPKTKEFITILQFGNMGNLRDILSNNFNYILWKDKIKLLHDLVTDLQYAHRLKCFHNDFRSENILRNNALYFISDFGSTFGVVMAEFSSGKTPFYNRKHNLSLAFDICNGLRPEFGEGTPDIYKRLSYKCMNANPDERPTSNELYRILRFWYSAIIGDNTEKLGKDIKAIFEKADTEIPNIITSYGTDPDAVYVSREFTFNNLPKPANSSMITSYLNEEHYEDSQLYGLGVASSFLPN
ncbi:kinase-like domain-containing protein [Rhizophagus clarus]|nr:kinase-like domain-containing protein [Rhizophagus clarus]